MTKLVSPNEMQEAACKEMLDGNAPKVRTDWVLCANFWAFNLEPSLAVLGTLMMGKILECPLSEEELTEVAEFQLRKKGY